MDPRITDPEVLILAGISASLEGDYTETENIWEGSPFGWIKTRPSRQVGAIGEKLVAGWLAARGFNVTRSPDSDADRVIEDKRMEIKFSTLWKNDGYKFQQLRDQNYDFALCIGASPFDAHCWVIPKSAILHHWRVTGDLKSQHGGSGGSDTAWLPVIPGAAPAWLQQYGGSMREALQLVSEQTGFTPEPPNGEEA